MKSVVFLLFFLFFITIYGYQDCLNQDEISEECIIEVYSEKDHSFVITHIDDVKFKNKSDGLIIKIDSLFRSANYDEIEKNINKLPLNFKNSLYYKVLLLKTNFARKRFNQTLEMIESVKKEYPYYYVSSDLECVKADIMLFRKQYDGALENYDRCLKIKSNMVSAYNRIVALEKNGPPKASLLKDYLEYYESYEGTFLTVRIIDRFVQMKKNSNIPNAASPNYSRWLAVMRKSSKLDLFFNDEYLTVPHPSNSEIIKYLVEKKRFSDALNMIDATISKLDKDVEMKFIYVVEKYRVLLAAGQDKAAADYMILATTQFSNSKKDRLLFFAGTIYFDAGFVAEGKKVLEEIVYKNQSSKYFLLALFKLGLIYLSEGSDLYTFALWTNYIYDSGMNYSKFISGDKVYEAISGLIGTIDRLNGFCMLSSDIDPDCQTGSVCQQNNGSRFITYYDFLYFHLTEREEFSRKIDVKDNSYVNKWKNSTFSAEVDMEIILERFDMLSKAAKQIEPAVMIKQFVLLNNREGVEFYLNYLNSVIGFNERKNYGPDIKFLDMKSYEELSVRFSEFRYKTNVVFKHYFRKTGDLADHYYNLVSPELTYSPHYGKIEEWKLIYPTPFIDEILKLSVEFEVPVQLIYSIMRAETYYRDDLSSNVGALGLMQIMPVTFEKISKFGGIKINDPMNPYDSMKASVWYLSKLLKRFDNNYAAAIAAYNAGPHRVSEWIKRYKGSQKYIFVEMIPFHETRNYVKKVLRFMEIYSYLYEGVFYDLGLNGAINIEENPAVVNF
ncbi:MAG TPA: lytic transglycosylase domain-containing protein [bacterium]|nr:lytic transglycosylase domain-containing protein [bacterium]